MQQKSDVQLEARLDRNLYDESQLIELKVPINLPYQTGWSGYERYDGEVTVNGTLYKYVERMVSNDTLYLKCLPNIGRMHLEDAKHDYFKNTNDLAQNSKSGNSGNSKTIGLKNLISDFDEPRGFTAGFFDLRPLKLFSAYAEQDLITFPHISPDQPPDLAGV